MATVHFLYRSTRPKAKLEARLQHTQNGINYLWGVKTQIEVTKDYWVKHKTNTRDREVKKEQIRVNELCGIIEEVLLNAFETMSPELVTKDWVQNQIDNHYSPEEFKEIKSIPKDIISYIDYYLDYRKNELSESMRKKVNVVKAKLLRLQTHRRQTIFIKDVNDSFKNEFVNYCKSKMYGQNTIQRELVFIKTFCKHAKFLGVETHNQLDGLRIDRAKVESIYLTFEELTAIENIEQSKLTDSLENARDWLLISCYCGQRVSDFLRFTADMIRIENGSSFIEFTQVKTGKIMTVPLHSKIKAILDKRKGQFPYPLSDQKYNDYIKTVCQLADINTKMKGSKLQNIGTKENPIFRKETKEYKKYELVSSHIGRRSFASNFYGTIPTTYLIYVTGHGTEAMFLNYIQKSNKDLAMEITKYF